MLACMLLALWGKRSHTRVQHKIRINRSTIMYDAAAT